MKNINIYMTELKSMIDNKFDEKKEGNVVDINNEENIDWLRNVKLKNNGKEKSLKLTKSELEKVVSEEILSLIKEKKCPVCDCDVPCECGETLDEIRKVIAEEVMDILADDKCNEIVHMVAAGASGALAKKSKSKRIAVKPSRKKPKKQGGKFKNLLKRLKESGVDEESLEELKKVVIRKGKKKKKDITMSTVMKNKKKFMLSPKRKLALRKARRKAHTAKAKRQKGRSMRIRKRYRK